MSSNEFYLRYYVGHKGKFGHEFLEFEFRPDGAYLDIFLLFKNNCLNLSLRCIILLNLILKLNFLLQENCVMQTIPITKMIP